jgi:hypothetical protein
MAMAILKFALAVALSAVLSVACFSPRQPACAFSCVSDGRCPTGYSCESDGLCHRDDGVGICILPSQTDAAQDGADDAGNDSATD